MAGGVGGKKFGRALERKNVKVWKREKVAYGIREIGTGFEIHQNRANKKYWTF